MPYIDILPGRFRKEVLLTKKAPEFRLNDMYSCKQIYLFSHVNDKESVVTENILSCFFVATAEFLPAPLSCLKEDIT